MEMKKTLAMLLFFLLLLIVFYLGALPHRLAMPIYALFTAFNVTYQLNIANTIISCVNGLCSNKVSFNERIVCAFGKLQNTLLIEIY